MRNRPSWLTDDNGDFVNLTKQIVHEVCEEDHVERSPLVDHEVEVLVNFVRYDPLILEMIWHLDECTSNAEIREEMANGLRGQVDCDFEIADLAEIRSKQKLEN